MTNFWEGEKCECCGGEIAEKRVTLHRKVKGNYVLLEDVPAGVCAQCGMRYYAANVLKTIEESVRGRRKADREVMVAVYSYS
jgi:YgiT-type zinc finger domain-containing protein